MISLRVPESEVAHASAVLDIHRPVDVHDRAVTSGIAPAAHVEAVQDKIELFRSPPSRTSPCRRSSPLRSRTCSVSPRSSSRSARNSPSGRTRVRRFVTEKEVAADVTLHEEHAEVLRRAIDDKAFIGDIDWADDEIEVIDRRARRRQEDRPHRRGSRAQEGRHRPRRDDRRQDPSPAGRDRAPRRRWQEARLKRKASCLDQHRRRPSAAWRGAKRLPALALVVSLNLGIKTYASPLMADANGPV